VSAAEQKAELRETVERMCATAFEEPAEGHTFWAFHTRDIERSLTPDEVQERLEDGTGVFLVELVWDEDDQLQERGEGQVVRTGEELLALVAARVSHMSDLVRDPSMAATAQPDEAGRGAPKPKTSTPWHPSGLSPKRDP
jgi:hypothetical protein